MRSLKAGIPEADFLSKKIFNTIGMYVILTGFKEKEWAEKLKG